MAFLLNYLKYANLLCVCGLILLSELCRLTGATDDAATPRTR